jgi:uncharacterized delta-60 repeat protein
MQILNWLRQAFSPRPLARPRPAARRLVLGYLEARDCPAGGVLDPTFGSGGAVTTNICNYIDGAWGVLVQPDGKLVTAGETYPPSSRTGEYFSVTRYNSDGSLDTAFGSGGNTTTTFGGNTLGQAVALQPGTGGKILVAGQAGTPKGAGFGLVRYNPNGSLDSTFSGKGKVVTYLGSSGAEATGMAVQSDGTILLVGETWALGYQSIALVRYTASGALDMTFGNGGKVVTTLGSSGSNWGGHDVSVVLQGDGKIVVAGTSSGQGSITHAGDLLVARFNANGTADATFGGGAGWVTTDLGAYESAAAVALQSDGRIVVTGGSNATPNATEAVALARYNTDGSLDSTFTGGAGAEVVGFPPPAPNTSALGWGTGLVQQSDGKIVVGGDYETLTYNSDGTHTATYAMMAVRINTDGTIDTSYGPSGTGITTKLINGRSLTHAMVLQPDGKVVLAGEAWSTLTGGATIAALTRFLATGPQIGSFTAAPNPVTASSSLTLTAGSIADGNAGATVTQVAFYVDSNGDGVLEPGTDTLLGYGTPNSDGTWTLSFSTAGWTAGMYTLFAQATDSYGAPGDPVSLTLQVQ